MTSSSSTFGTWQVFGISSLLLMRLPSVLNRFGHSCVDLIVAAHRPNNWRSANVAFDKFDDCSRTWPLRLLACIPNLVGCSVHRYFLFFGPTCLGAILFFYHLACLSLFASPWVARSFYHLGKVAPLESDGAVDFYVVNFLFAYPTSKRSGGNPKQRRYFFHC